MAMTAKSSNGATQMQIIMTISAYMAMALVMVFVNKAVLSNFSDLPFTFLSIQMVLAVLLLHLTSFLFPKRIEIVSVDRGVARQLVPVVFTGVIGLVFNTLCLKYASTSFFIIARGLALPFTIAVSASISSGLPNMQVLGAAAIVTGGFFFGISPAAIFFPAGETGIGGHHIHSVLYGIMSSFTLALHAVLVKKAHSYVGGSVTKLSYYTNLMSAVILIPFIIGNGELQALFLPGRNWGPFVLGSAVTGLVGFLLGIASLLSIKVTSPVTHMFSSAARSVLQTLLGVWLFNEVVNSTRAISISIITIGALYYTYVQSSNPTPRKHRSRLSAEDLEEGQLREKAKI